MIVLGLETSCDETAIALVRDDKTILSHIVLSQLKEHEEFGGVVPEIAARSHLEAIPKMLNEAFAQAQLTADQIDAVAVTAGPGLIGGVLVGSMVAKSLAASLNKPIIAVNHLEGHALTIRLVEDLAFPYLLLLVSGGHCQILLAKNLGEYQVLGSTLDDALGEAFDKVAKMLGLGYPGGPLVEQLAKGGNANAYNLPKPLINDGSCNFSFSGLKTAVKNLVDSNGPLNDQQRADVCASFQQTVASILSKKMSNAVKLLGDTTKTIVIAGGVAANQYIRQKLAQEMTGLTIFAPPLNLCTDNAAMIAWVGIERLKAGTVDELSFAPRSRWPLGDLQ
jgi:N6-L-threonylcarbamoyladenine synthase